MPFPIEIDLPRPLVITPTPSIPELVDQCVEFSRALAATPRHMRFTKANTHHIGDGLMGNAVAYLVDRRDLLIDQAVWRNIGQRDHRYHLMSSVFGNSISGELFSSFMFIYGERHCDDDVEPTNHVYQLRHDMMTVGDIAHLIHIASHGVDTPLPDADSFNDALLVTTDLLMAAAILCGFRDAGGGFHQKDALRDSMLRNITLQFLQTEWTKYDGANPPIMSKAVSDLVVMFKTHLNLMFPLVDRRFDVEG